MDVAACESKYNNCVKFYGPADPSTWKTFPKSGYKAVEDSQEYTVVNEKFAADNRSILRYKASTKTAFTDGYTKCGVKSC